MAIRRYQGRKRLLELCFSECSGGHELNNAGAHHVGYGKKKDYRKVRRMWVEESSCGWYMWAYICAYREKKVGVGVTRDVGYTIDSKVIPIMRPTCGGDGEGWVGREPLWKRVEGCLPSLQWKMENRLLMWTGIDGLKIGLSSLDMAHFDWKKKTISFFPSQ